MKPFSCTEKTSICLTASFRPATRNYYLAETTIIHYKGESTKKGSLNYVRTFYKAMIIFARKHFKGDQARSFIFLLQLAIYMRAFLTLLHNWGRRLFFPARCHRYLFGHVFLERFLGHLLFQNPDYYQPSFVYFNIPLYIGIWLSAVYSVAAMINREAFAR